MSNVTFNGQALNNVKFVRNLGVVFNDTMSLEQHVTSVCRKAFYNLYNISRIRKYLDFNSCQTVILALVISHLDQCNALFYNLPQYLLDKLQKVQNAAARVLARTPFRHHITPILASLHWLPAKHRIVFKFLVIVNKCLHGLGPFYLCNLLSFYQPDRVLRSCSQLLLQSNVASRKYGDRSFSVAAPKLWNSLPMHC